MDQSKISPSEYKRYHEAFMQDNIGSTAAHTFCSILITVLCSLIVVIINSNGKQSTTGRIVQEYVIIVLPMVLAHTVLCDSTYHITVALATVVAVFTLGKLKNINVWTVLNEKNVLKSKQVLSISFIRALTYLITIFSILAVDFQVFPRHLAKTEKFGYSFMDTGVGLFVLMSGLVHKDYQKERFTSFVKDNAKLVAILLILGISRFLAVKSVNYHEHVTEYGVHWNFFFTIAFSKASSLVLYIRKINKHTVIFGFSLLIFHEMLLSLGLQDWVFSDSPRDTLLAANREGISSCLGYVSMYIIAVGIKQEICRKDVPKVNVILKLLTSSATMWLFIGVVSTVKPPSRTLANLSYCSFIIAILVTVLSVLYFVEATFVFSGNKSLLMLPKILDILNKNGLLCFLIANLLTGAVNLRVQTLLVDNLVGLLIINIYMIINILIGIYLDAKGFKL